MAALALSASLVWYLGRDTPAAVDTQAAVDVARASNADGVADAEDVDGVADAEDSDRVADTEDADRVADAEDADGVADVEDALGDRPDGDAADVDASGTWRVSDEVVAYDFDDGTGTFVGFRIAEELTTVGATEAVGRTPEVTGDLVVDGATITDASITGDLTALRTDISRRDGRVQSALDTTTFPTAEFALTDEVELDSAPAAGDTVTVEAPGEFTLHGVTRPVSVTLEAVLIDAATLLVTGSYEITLADHGIVAPSAPIVVSVADTGTIELQLYLTRD